MMSSSVDTPEQDQMMAWHVHEFGPPSVMPGMICRSSQPRR